MYCTDFAEFRDKGHTDMAKAICQKCNNEWKPHGGRFPRTCPFCSSTTWTQPKRGGIPNG